MTLRSITLNVVLLKMVLSGCGPQEVAVMDKKTPVVKFYSAWFCPYAQRAWAALNLFKIKYDLVESLDFDLENDPVGMQYKKHPDLLKANPKGLVPTLVIDYGEEGTVMSEAPPEGMLGIPGGELMHRMTMSESIDIVHFLCEEMLRDRRYNLPLEDGVNREAWLRRIEKDPPLVTSEALLADAHRMNQETCSPFYKVLIPQDFRTQRRGWEATKAGLRGFVAELRPFYKSDAGPTIVDVVVFPWVRRLTVLEYYR